MFVILFPIITGRGVSMTFKNKLLSLVFFAFSVVAFAHTGSQSDQKNVNSIQLLKNVQENAIVFYWDTLSSTGILEKNGHQISFRAGDNLLVMDGSLLVLSDAPSIQEGVIMVSKDFVDSVQRYFSSESDGSGFKIGAILIDPGHGGKDPGASQTFTVNGKKITVTEKDITLAVGKKLNALLKKSYPDKKIIMTRDVDKFLGLSERTEIANSVQLKNQEAILYVSVHVNASLDKNASGYETWYLSPGYRRTVIDKSSLGNDTNLFPILNSLMEEEYTTESILMAKFIMDGLESQIGDKSKARGIKAEEWFVVKNSKMPAVLVEVGFLTNEKEALNLNDDAYLQKISLGIYNGLQAFITHFERSKGFTESK